MSIDEMIEVLQAAKAGNAIEWKRRGGQWHPANDGCFDFEGFEYRVKPEPWRFWIVAEPHKVINAYHHEPTGLREVDEAIEVVEVIK